MSISGSQEDIKVTYLIFIEQLDYAFQQSMHCTLHSESEHLQ